MNKKKLSFIFILMLFVSSLAFGQVLQLRPFDGTPSSYIIAQIRADTTANHGILPTRIYELTNGGVYLSTEILTLNGTSVKLRLRAPAGPKPIIYLYPTGTGANPQRPPGNFVVLNGASIEFTNIAIAGIFEPTPTEINNMQGGLINTTGVGSRIILDDCILTNTNGNHVRTGSSTKLIKVTNCIFANMGSLTTSNFGAGKGFDLREQACDSLILVNNTFTNYQDRVVRHLNLATGNTVTGILGYALIDHNTFLNGMGFHGLLSLGNVGKKVQITNNLFVDAFALGADSLDVTRNVEFNNTGEKYPNGQNTMPWIFTAPNDTTVWKVEKNYYSTSNAGLAFFAAHPRHFEGAQLTNHILSRLGSGAATAFTKMTNFSLVKTPKLMINLMNYYISPTGGNYTKNVPGYNYLVNDMDRRTIQYYRDTLNCTYEIAYPAYRGGIGGYPVGDLNWFPTQKIDWENGIGLGVEKTDALPTTYSLSQNYPNPFNPTTMIEFSILKSGFYSLKVYNLLGQEIASLMNGELTAGTYKTDFDASKLSSGVYVYKLSGPNVSIAKKMVLMK
ncbi:MAG: T9SS type A sorting domain-containing protein [Ignavibacteriales bacterium]|nr:T9SS type A sorting domain-containing protein [Ignavibacteriales bacterium]